MGRIWIWKHDDDNANEKYLYSIMYIKILDSTYLPIPTQKQLKKSVHSFFYMVLLSLSMRCCGGFFSLENLMKGS